MPYGIDQAIWNRLPPDDRAAIIAAASPPPPPPPAVPAPPPPPAVPPPPPATVPPVPADVVAAADAAAAYVSASIAALLAGGSSADMAAAAQAAGAPPDVVANLLGLDIPAAAGPTPSVDAGEAGAIAGDSLDDEPDAEAGPEPSADDYAALQLEADAIDSGQFVTAAVTHPAPGTIIGVPYKNSHAVAFNRAGGSDNWQSENAVDVWLFPGTAITACADGVISPGGYGYGLSSSGGRFAGWRLHLITDNGKAFFYTHCSTLIAKKGARVVAGQLIARSGIANGVPHLHFAARPPFDPLAFVKLAYSLKDRTPIADPVIGGVAVQGGLPNFDLNDGEVRDGWMHLMRALGVTAPTAAAHIRDARALLDRAVS